MKKNGFIQRLLALALVTAMVYSFLPTDAFAASGETTAQAASGTKVADTETLTRPTDIYGENTKNAGKVTVGKSVSEKAVTLEYGDSAAEFTPADDSFIVTVSQAAQVMALASESSQPVDVVFVLDTSGSMDDNDRAESMVKAANSAISAILAANENNRVGVVAFSSAGNYGGGTSNGDAANMLSALAHYDGDAATNHLQWVTSDGSTTVSESGNNNSSRKGPDGGPGGDQDSDQNNSLSYIAGRSTTTSGNSTTLNRRNGYNGGTNIQAGIALGASLLTNETSTTVTADGKTVTRIPFLIILSDGAPTFSSTSSNWYEPSQTGEQGPGSSPYEGNGFLAVMTAAYYKGKITEHYYGDKASEENRCFVYTVGVELDKISENGVNDEEALAQVTMDPSTYAVDTNDYYVYGNTWDNDWNQSTNNSFKTYWENYVKGNTFNIRVNQDKTFSVTAASITATKNYVNGVSSAGKTMYTGGLAYNDDYFNASSTSELEQIFKDLVNTIQLKAISSPTKVDEAVTEDFSGYVTFTDPLGEYMEVKNMYGVLADGHYFQGIAVAKHLSNYSGGTYYDAEFNATFKKVLTERFKLTGSDINVDAFISAAVDSANQAYYNSDTDYDNSIVWWGSSYNSGEEDEQVQCLGWAADDSIEYIESAKASGNVIPAGADYVCRSYFFYGTANETVDNANHEYLYFVVRVQRSLTAPYQQTVVISAPASLLSVEKVLVTEETDENGDQTYTASVQKAEPARVVYEVGLRSDINAYNVAQILAEDSAYTTEAPVAEADGSVVGKPNVEGDTYHFYTNDWDRSKSAASHTRAMTTATFDAAADNSFYTYQQDTLILDAQGEPYTGTTAPEGLYYYAREYYDWAGAALNEDGTYNCVKKTALIEVRLDGSSAVKQGEDGGWYITAGTYAASTLMVAGDDVTKTANNTETSQVVAHPRRTGDSDNSHYTVYLGNNGRLSLTAQPTKQVDITRADQTQILDADGAVVMVGDTLTYTVKAANTTDQTATLTVTDTVPTGTAYVEGSAGSGVYDPQTGKLTWTLKDMAAGEETTVSFQVTVTEAALSGADDVVTIDNTATVSLGNDPLYTTNTTSNPPEGKKVVGSDGNALPEGGVQVGDVLVYRIRYYNDADTAATVTIRDIIPTGTAYVEGSASHNGVCADGQVTWTLTDVQPGTSGVVSFRVVVDASVTDVTDGTITNNASIQIGENDPRQTNDTDTEVQKPGDLVLTKTVQVTSGNEAQAKAQTFTLTLTETSGKLNGTFSGVTFTNGLATVEIRDGQQVTVSGLPAGITIVVTETAKAGFVAAYSPADRVTIPSGEETGVALTNTYSVQATTVELEATKQLSTTTVLADTTFGFTAVRCDAQGTALSGYAPLTGSADVSSQNHSARVTFSPLALTEEGIYYYLISEVNGNLTGVTYDDTQYLLTITVTDNGEGKLVASTALASRQGGTGAFTAAEAMTFTNKYQPKETQLVLEGTKSLAGRVLKADEFSFVVKENGSEVSTGLVDANGKISFRPITYTEPGTHTYTISEVNGGLNGVTYDPATYTVTVKVEDVNGQLVATPVYPEGGVAFANSYEPDEVSVTLTGTKTLTGAAADGLTANEYSFIVVDQQTGEQVAVGSNAAGSSSGKITFTPIVYDIDDLGGAASKRFTYLVKEVMPNGAAGAADPNMKYDDRQYTFEVTLTYDQSTGLLSVDRAQIDVGTFTNIQNPSEITVTPAAFKVTQGNAPEDASFSFSVLDEAGNVATTGIAYASGQKQMISFGNLVYDADDVGSTYTYTIRETKASAEKNNGITYDQSVYTMKVTIGRDGNNALTADVAYFDAAGSELSAAPTFTNTYAAEGYLTVALPDGAKTLNGKELAAGDFSFQITDAAGNVVATGTNDAKGAVTFSGIYYTLADLPGGQDQTTITYTLSEIPGAHPGVSYDKTAYQVVVTLTHDNNGGISTSYVIRDGEGKEVSGTALFQNTYQAEKGVTYSIDAAKVLSGRAMKAGEFGFELYYLSATGKEYLVGTAYNDADGKVSFQRTMGPTVPAGTYTYRISEVNGGKTIHGVTYTSAQYWAKVVVVNNTAEAKLEVASITYYSDAACTQEVVPQSVVFTNTYDAADTTFTPEAGKVLTGRTMTDHEFSFEVKEGSTVVSTGLSKADGTIVFSPIGYTAAGIHTYTISEVQGKLPGVTYDGTVYTVTVTVTDNTDTGKLEAAAVYPEGGITFRNTYTPQDASVQFQANKVLSGRAMTQGEFSFLVKDAAGNIAATGSNHADGSVSFSSIGYQPSDLNGQTKAVFLYSMEETVTGQGGVTFDSSVYWVRVTVTDNAATGKLETRVEYFEDQGCTKALSGVPTFNNAYAPSDVSVSLTAYKKLINKTLAEGEFSFELKDADGTVLQTKRNDSGGAVSFDAIKFTAPGRYVYTVNEVKGEDSRYVYDESVITVVVTVTDDALGALHATVTYHKDQANGADVDLGTMEFTNTYTPGGIEADLDADLGLAANKTVTDPDGKQLDQLSGFQFVVTDISGQTVTTGVSGADGSIDFGSLTFASAGEYHYWVSEVVDETRGGYTWDSAAWEVHILVRYDADKGELYVGEGDVKIYQPNQSGKASVSSMEFVNVYEPAAVTLELALTKELTGRPLKAGEFTFHLMEGADHAIIRDEDFNAADGSVKLDTTITTAGTHVFTIHEHAPADRLGGVTYDDTVYTVTVTVEDQNGKLEITSVEKTDLSGAPVSGIVFENTYEVAPVQVDVTAAKAMLGRDLVEGEFSFLLKDANGEVLQTKQNAADGTVAFDPLRYAQAGVYTYTLSEAAGEAGGVTYDATEYILTVTVTDDLKGQLHAEMVYSVEDAVLSGAPTFTNSYDITGTEELNLSGTKTLSGKSLVGGAFTFQVWEGDTQVACAVNDGEGKILFPAISYTKDDIGTHVYTVKEQNAGQTIGGITYDATVYTVTVTVSDNGEGGLKVETSGDAIDTLNFTNTYKTGTATVTLEGTKVLTGRDLAEGEFSFEVKDSQGSVVAAGTNDAQGKITFTPITLNAAGEYVYTVSEVQGSAENVTYDGKTYTVTVSVVDDNGVLTATVTGPEDGITFSNTYEAPAQPGKEDDGGQKNNSPKTGDNSKVGIVVVVLVVCVICLVVLLLVGKNKKQKGKHEGKREG